MLMSFRSRQIRIMFLTEFLYIREILIRKPYCTRIMILLSLMPQTYVTMCDFSHGTVRISKKLSSFFMDMRY